MYGLALIIFVVSEKKAFPGMIIGRSSTKLGFLCRSEIKDGHHCRKSINIGTYGKMFKCLLLRNYKYD
jgi:hypothetical protein